MPDSPMHAKCFSLEDRLLMTERVRKNETGIQNKTFKVSDFINRLQKWTQSALFVDVPSR